jgi:putative oxidoreductase
METTMSESVAKPASRFDLSEPEVYFRVMCGVLYVPHILFKLNSMESSAVFFAKAGFSPGYAFVILALVLETISAIGLTFGFFVKWTGLISAGVLAVAAYAVCVTKGAGWLWNLGGVEYLVFWSLGSLVFAIKEWKQEFARYGRLSLLRPISA